MDLSKVLFRPHRGGLDASLREVVSFDDLYQLVDYIFTTYNFVPLLQFYGFDERIGWNTFVLLDNNTFLPYGFVHVPLSAST